MRREKLKENKKIPEKNKTVRKKEKITVKSYLRDFLVFLDKNLLKTMGILFIIAILLIAITISSSVGLIKAQNCEGTCRDGITVFSEYFSVIQILLVTAVAGMVPYMYAPVVGFCGVVMNEVVKLSYAIKGYGYLVGILLGIIPIILNLLVVCLITALGIYICRTVTISYRISSVKNMNSMNFRIKLYEMINKQEKAKQLTKKKEEKLKKLESKKQKINYLQILNVSVVAGVLQFIAVLIQEIIL